MKSKPKIPQSLASLLAGCASHGYKGGRQSLARPRLVANRSREPVPEQEPWEPTEAEVRALERRRVGN